MRGDYGGTDLLENADFPPRKAKSADEGGVRVTQFQGAESPERGNRFILPFCAPHGATLALVRRRQAWIHLIAFSAHHPPVPVPVALLLPPRSQVEVRKRFRACRIRGGDYQRPIGTETR